MQRVADRAVEELGRIDIMVANAGAFSSAPVHEMTAEQWDVVIDVDLTGVFNSIRSVAPTMVAQRSGRIVAISSVAGRAGYGNLSNYCAAKWGVIGLVKASAIDLGPYGITVNAVCPGQTDTPLLDNDALLKLWFPDMEHPTSEDMDHLILTTMHHIPVARLPPDEVSNAIVFLASEGARYVSGCTIDIAAGMAANYTG
jgi:NAD(P)-dependent dehydrogenase (short-subunit alcohol dehydrogenase family)